MPVLRPIRASNNEVVSGGYRQKLILFTKIETVKHRPELRLVQDI